MWSDHGSIGYKLSLVQLMGVFSKGVKDVSALILSFGRFEIFSRLTALNYTYSRKLNMKLMFKNYQ